MPIYTYTLNNIGSLEGTLQYYCHVTPGGPFLGLHSKSTEGLFLKNLYCLDMLEGRLELNQENDCKMRTTLHNVGYLLYDQGT